MAKEKIVVKLGGSLITDKTSQMPKIDKLQMSKIGSILNQEKYDLILVHGAGSYGHPIAKKYAIAQGSDGTTEQEEAVQETRKQVRELNQELCKYLNEEGMDIVPISPSLNMKTKGPNEIIDFPINMFDEVLNIGKTPITYGDVTDDERQGICVLSGDLLMSELSKIYKPLYSIFVMDQAGVFDGDPCNPESSVMPSINYDTVKILLNQNSSSPTIDVTGGLIRKVECALNIAKYSETWITKLDSLNGFFDGNPKGSKVIV